MSAHDAALGVTASAYSAVRDLQRVGTWSSAAWNDEHAAAIVSAAVDYADRLIEAAQLIVALHRPGSMLPVCVECRHPSPCPTIKALAAA